MKSTAEKIRAYMAKHPNAKAAEVAQKFGTSTSYVYIVRGKAKQQPEKDDWVLTHVASSDEPLNKLSNKQMPAPVNDVDATLAERGKRYGSFKGHAAITISLKKLISAALSLRGMELDSDQQEALDMICHKIGRIVNGDPNYVDSWIDIAGYAKLVADRLEGKEV